MRNQGKLQAVQDWSRDLPDDIFYEILTRVQLETLDSCRKVCSKWRRMTYEPNFIAGHCSRAKTVRGYFLQDMRTNVYYSSFVSYGALPSSVPAPPSLDFLPEGTQIWSSTNRGILCCQSPYKYQIPRFYVCKPVTKQFRPIPNPRTRFHTIAMAIVTSPDGVLHFKIVRLSAPRNDISYTICEVFDSRIWRWRRYREKLPPLMLGPHPSVEINNVIYWLGSYSKKIFAFDTVKESPMLIEMPDWSDGSYSWRDTTRLARCEGKLCLVRALQRDPNSTIEELEVWMIVDNAAGNWKKVQMERLTGMHQNTFEDLFTRQIMFLMSIGEAIWLDLRSGQMTKERTDCFYPKEAFELSQT